MPCWRRVGACRHGMFMAGSKAPWGGMGRTLEGLQSIGRRASRIVSAVCLSLAALGSAQGAQPMVFQTLSLEDGLSQSTVNDSFQDSRGFMWFATQNGLNRYDGYTVKTYLRDRQNPQALESDFIWSIAEDAGGDLWLATEGAGLVHWARDQDRFRTVLPATALDAEPARRLARVVHIDEQGRIWVGTRGAGLLQFSAKGALAREFRQASEALPGLAHDVISVIQPAAQGGLWLGTDGGLNWLDPDAGTLSVVEGLPTPAPAISSIAQDQAGRLWLGTFESGLLVRDPSETAFRQLRHVAGDAASLSSDKVRKVFVDDSGRVWIATQDGLNLYLPKSDGFVRYQHDNADRYSLADNRLMSISQDRGGLLWVGSRIGGAHRWNPRSWSLGSQQPAALAGAAVLAFAGADAGTGAVWVGGFGAPLLRISAQGHELETFSPDHGYPALGDAPVTALLKDRRGGLWIGSMGDGLKRFDPRHGGLDHLRHNPDDAASLGADGIMTLFEDDQGHIWAGTFGGGLARIDPHSLKVQRYAPDPDRPDSISGARVTSLAQGPDGRLWVGTDGGGLNVLDIGSGRFRHYRYDQARPGSLGSDTIYALHVSADGSLWIGTAGAGLARLGPERQTQAEPEFESWTTAQGLSSNVINGIREDDQGQLWLSSNSGLMRMDRASGRTDVFHRVHGLVGEEFNFGAHFRAADGRLFFGANGGYNAFDPDGVETLRQPPEVVLTRFEKFNEPAPTEVPYADLRSVELGHADDVITFEYAALDFTAPDKNLYSVMLEGFDRDWSAPHPRRRSTYTNLDPGHYRFRVRAANSDGIWAERSLDIAIRVQPAPWATPWAYAAYFLLLSTAVFAYFRYRLRSMEREARIRQLAYYDKVSGLPNRELFEIRVQDAIRRIAQGADALDIISLRIGPIKLLGDTLGHRAADDVLRLLTSRLTQVFFGAAGVDEVPRDLARLDDETVVAFVQFGEGDLDGMGWARRMAQAVSEPLTHDGHRVSVPSHAGVASFGLDGREVTQLIAYSGTAARDAREARRDVLHYTAEMTAQAMERLSLEGDLREALEHDELELYFQGKFNAAGELVGAETLCRWHHPIRGTVSPAVFVPLAEQSGLIVELDRWVISQVFAVLHDQHLAGAPPLAVAVNVSAETFTSGLILQILETQSRRYQVDPTRLEIEITETVMVRDVEQVVDSLHRIKQLGYRISLDDFGTGYSSLTYLQRMPVDMVKIDQSFVQDLETRPDQRTMCAAIVGIARSLGLKTIVEGVETPRQLEILTELGCDQFQGFGLHRPQPVGDFLRERGRRPG